MKIKLIFDSSCGKSEKQIHELGGGFLPILVTFDGKEYKSGVNIDSKWLGENMTTETKVKTASVLQGEMVRVFEEQLLEADHIVYIPLSQHLSSTNATAKMVANMEEYKGKVTVIDSNFVTPLIEPFVARLFEIAAEGDLIKLLDSIDVINTDTVAWFTPITLEFLYAGGRVSKTQYLAGSLLKVTPIITAYNGDLTAKEVIKSRKLDGAVNKIVDIIVERKKEFDDAGTDVSLIIIDQGANKSEDLIAKLDELGVVYNKDEISYTGISPALVAHVGPTIFGAGWVRKI